MLDILIAFGIGLVLVLCGFFFWKITNRPKHPKAELIIKDGQIINLDLDLDAVMESDYILMKVTRIRN